MELGLFNGQDKPSVQTVWAFYERGLRYNNQIDLEETVRCNENFYIGKQWENVEANGLPTPTFNFIKRVVMFDVATITANNIKATASALAHTPNTDELIRPVQVVNEEFDAACERCDIAGKARVMTRDAAVRGDGCIYGYWEDDDFNCEGLDNSDVFFGNPTDNRVQKQPYIIIRSQLPTREVKLRAKEFEQNWEAIQPDEEFANVMDSAKVVDDMTTLLLCLWRDDETKTIWGYECTKTCEVREAWDLQISLYPVVWMNWDYVKNSYHGQAMVTGILNNQIFVNRAWAMSMLSMMKTAYPKYAIDGTRIKSLDNRVGGFIKTQGDPHSAIMSVDPPVISPQVAQYIQLAIEETEKCLGATSVALGDTRPDNTSAIIALQRAAATPIELTKRALHAAMEDLFRIFLEFMSVNYGVRKIDTEVPPEVADAYRMAGMEPPETIVADFDFGTLKDHAFSIKLDIGDSSYFSEISSIETLSRLFQQSDDIDILDVLRRVPEDYIIDRRGLIKDIEDRRAKQQQMMAETPPETPDEEQSIDEMEIPTTGGGYGTLQRAINKGVMAS